MSKCVLYEYVYMYVYCLCLYVCMYFCKYVCIIWNVRVYECMCICVQAPSKVMCFNFYLYCVNLFYGCLPVCFTHQARIYIGMCVFVVHMWIVFVFMHDMCFYVNVCVCMCMEVNLSVCLCGGIWLQVRICVCFQCVWKHVCVYIYCMYNII